MPLVRRLAVVMLAAALVAGCGDDDDGAGADQLPDENVPAAPKATNEVTVRETEFALDPARATAGEAGLVTIKIVNEGEAAHSLAVDGPNGLVELDGRIEPGATSTLEVDLDRPGSYAWYCPLDGHRERGMEGSITVGGEDAARGAESTLTTPTTPTGTDTTETETDTRTQTETQTRTTTQTETVTTPTETDDGPTATVRTPSD